MFRLVVVFVGVFLWGGTEGIPVPPEGSDNKTPIGEEGSIFDDRINLNINNAHAHAYNRDGSFSGSDSSSLGIQAGILHPGNRYQHLGGQTLSNSNSYSTGRFPPQTYANTGAAFGPYNSRGQAASGFRGGQGQAYANSQQKQIAIPLGPFPGGPVLLSNLPDASEQTDKKTKTNIKKDHDKSSSDKEFVFSDA